MTRHMIEAAGDLHGRAVPEWIGRNPDTPCPDHVKVRVFLRQSRKCARTGRPYRPGDVLIGDHIKRLKDGGENREGNIQIILERKAHDEKTADENRQGAKELRLQKKHYGLKKPSSFHRFTPRVRQIHEEADHDT